MSGTLDGVTILVTRPAGQAAHLCRMIEAAGGKAVHVPTLEISPVEDFVALREAVGDTDRFDIVIFVSPNAVRFGRRLFDEPGSVSGAIAAIGASTSRALSQAGFEVSIQPENGFTSESLLKHDALQEVGEKSVLIVRGNGGRETLADVLRERGASVEYAEVYMRGRPDTDVANLEKLLERGEIDVVTATSAASLANLHGMLSEGARASLNDSQLVVPSERVVKMAESLGFSATPLIADGPDDRAVLETITRWTRQRDASASTETMIEKPIEKAQADAGPPASRGATEKKSGSVLSPIALLIALGAAALAGWQWYSARSASVDDPAAGIDARIDSGIDAARSELMRSVTDLDDKFEESENALDELRTEAQSLRGRVSAIDALNSRVRKAEQSLESLRGVSDTARNELLLAETEYFMQTANGSLQLARNPGAALAALKEADRRLEAMADPALLDVRADLAREMTALEAIPRPDVAGIALKLGSLSATVGDLALRNRHPSEYEAPGSDEDADSSALERAKNKVVGALGNMMTIRQEDKDIVPLLAPEERFFLTRNIELKLEIARLAVMQGDTENFRESVRAARQWLESYYDPTSNGVKSAISTLAELEAENISPALPDISGSLARLREATAGG